MDYVCDQPAYSRAGQYSGVVRGVPNFPLEFYPVGVLSGSGGCFWFHAACKKEKQTEVFRGMPSIIGKANGRNCREDY